MKIIFKENKKCEETILYTLLITINSYRRLVSVFNIFI